MQYNIAAAADTKYYVPMYIMLLSLFENNRDLKLNVFILHNELGEDHKNEIISLAKKFDNSITWVYVDGSEASNYHVSAYITKASYYRILLADLLPVEVDKLLYLDLDIVVNGSIKELLETDITNCPLAAVKDTLPFKVERYNIFPPYDYFNAGVLLLSLSEWRKNGYASRLKSNLSANPQNYPLYDQDVLNEFFYKTVKYLDPKWNHQTPLYIVDRQYSENRYEIASEDIFANPVIIHFTGWLKPWLYMCTHPLKPLFLYYLNKSNYKDFAEKGSILLWIKKILKRIKHNLYKMFA